MQKTLAALATATAGTLCLAGCGLTPPTADVTEARVDAATPEGSRVVFTVTLQNANDVPLPIRRTNYTVTLGTQSFEFTDLAAATIPANGAQVVVIPAAFAVPEAGLSGAAYELRGHVTYEPPGEVRDLLTDSGVPLPRVGFVERGTFEGGLDQP